MTLEKADRIKNLKLEYDKTMDIVRFIQGQSHGFSTLNEKEKSQIQNIIAFINAGNNHWGVPLKATIIKFFTIYLDELKDKIEDF